jgi:hypothetical protein
MIFEKKSILHSMERERNEICFLQNANYCKQQRQVFVEKHGMQRTIHKQEVKRASKRATREPPAAG